MQWSLRHDKLQQRLLQDGCHSVGLSGVVTSIAVDPVCCCVIKVYYTLSESLNNCDQGFNALRVQGLYGMTGL
jgi:hypothetical protein